MSAVVGALACVWLGGGIAIAHMTWLGARCTSTPFGALDALTCAMWPIYAASDVIAALREPRP